MKLDVGSIVKTPPLIVNLELLKISKLSTSVPSAESSLKLIVPTPVVAAADAIGLLNVSTIFVATPTLVAPILG